jgi:flagellar hook-associated protein 3 FlgL
MRISTSAFQKLAVDNMLNQQSALSITQTQVSTGKRIQSPADDPIGAVHILELQKVQAEYDQYGRNSDAVVGRSNVEEQSLADAGDLLRNVHDLVLQANNSTLSDTDRTSIVSELTARAQQLMDIANRKDGKGEYLFAGYATTTQPFVRSGAGVSYLGDQGVRVIQTGPTQKTADSHTGFDVFMNVPQGNGTFVTSANASNTGGGSIDAGAVTNPTAWVPDTYTISFTAPDTYQIVGATSGVVVAATPGNYVSGNGITFNGVQMTINGTPAAGDTFTVAPSQKEDMFTTIDNIITALKGGGTPAADALMTTRLTGALAQLDQHEQKLLNVRADVGARLSSLDDAANSRDEFKIELQRNLSSLQDVDYTEAISRMNQQMLGLQAAQKSYSQLSQLSLFNYLS